MSLINDALKQAKAAQPPKTAAPADGPALRPVDGVRRSEGTGFLLPALVVVILALAVTLLWIWFHSSGPAELAVRARTVSETVQVKPAPAPEPVKQAAEAPVMPQVKPLEPATNATVTIAVPTISNTNSGTVEVANIVVPKPEPPTYKLQAIFYNPKRPSAMVSGKTVFVGDHVKGAQVVSIEPESVTIVTQDGEKKVMELN